MEDTNKELERIQNELFKEELQEMSLDEILGDEELNALLKEKAEPAFDDPEKIHDPAEPLVYQNFANNYGEEKQPDADNRAKRSRDEKIIMGLMITASVLSLGIIAILGYWLTVLF